MGVRDALRMVDSFIKWARRNEDRAKALDDFIHDGLVAAAKRCESCLKDDLGLKFTDELPSDEDVPSGYEMGSTMEVPDEEGFEVTPDDLTPGPSEVLIESESESITIDTVGRIDEEEMEDISIDGPPREFSSDFELVEPADLVVESTPSEDEELSTPDSETDAEFPEETEHKPSFTWADYEKAVAPSKEDMEPVAEDENLPPPAEMEPADELSATEGIPEPPDSPEDDFEGNMDDVDETDNSEDITEPPAPPPPPESDEDEDERRRRARRLFFGD